MVSLALAAVLFLTAFAVPALADTSMVAGDWGKTTRDEVYFRKTPSTGGDFWARLPKNWELQVLGTKTANGILGYKVKGGTPKWPDRSYTGYIHSDYFTKSRSGSTAAKAVVTAKPAAASAKAGATKGYVRTVRSGVNIRNNPAGAILTGKNESKIPSGVILAYDAGPVTAGGYDWVRVSYLGLRGYIRSDCWILTNATGKAVTASAKATKAPTTKQGYITLTKGGVNFRDQPNGIMLGRLDKGTVLSYYGEVVSGTQTWYHAYSAEIGSYGYVLASLAKISNTAKAATTPKPGTVVVPTTDGTGTLVTTADNLNLRKTPSLAAESLLKIANAGVTLDYKDSRQVAGAYWYKVTYGGKTGWIHGSFVRITSTKKATSAPVIPSSGSATPVPDASKLSSTAITLLKKVRIRKSPSMSGAEIDMVAKANTKGTYLGKYSAATKSNPYTWYYVKFGKTTGWMRGDCVRILTDSENTAYAATGNADAPAEATYTTLKKGSTGSAVTELQTALAAKGYLKESQITGMYDTDTEKAVIAFQKANKLTADGIAGEKTQHALYNTVPAGTYEGTNTDNKNLYPVEKVDWYKGDIQSVWTVGSVATVTDVYTGTVMNMYRIYGTNHADVVPATKADTKAYCSIFGVSNSQEVDDRQSELQSWRRRPLWVTIGGRTFAASMYGIPHNFAGDRIPDNGYNGQFCVHFTNSMTHGSGSLPAQVDPDASYNNYFGHQSAINYAYTHSITGTK